MFENFRQFYLNFKNFTPLVTI